MVVRLSEQNEVPAFAACDALRSALPAPPKKISGTAGPRRRRASRLRRLSNARLPQRSPSNDNGNFILALLSSPATVFRFLHHPLSGLFFLCRHCRTATQLRLPDGGSQRWTLLPSLPLVKTSSMLTRCWPPFSPASPPPPLLRRRRILAALFARTPPLRRPC